MIKSIFLVGAVLSSILIFKFGGKQGAKVEAVQVEKSVMNAAMLDNDFVSFMNSKTIPDLVYNVDTRFIEKITKHKVNAARTIREVFPEEVAKKMKSINDTRLVMIGKDGDEEVWGSGAEMSSEQVKMIKTFDYSQDFYLEAYVKNQHDYNEKIVYFFTVVPNQAAQFKDGKEALTKFLRIESLASVSEVKSGTVKPGRISFTINEAGDVIDADLDSSSGYETFDKKMLELIQDLPTNWEAAKNIKGEAVQDKLVLFFGTQGC